jgi:hypothetical protein
MSLTSTETKGLSAGHQPAEIVRSILRFLKRRRTLSEFIWLSICLIEQQDSAIQADEIATQARRFQNAKHCYVWLSHTPYLRLARLLDDLHAADYGLQKEPFDHEFLTMGTNE